MRTLDYRCNILWDARERQLLCFWLQHDHQDSESFSHSIAYHPYRDTNIGHNFYRLISSCPDFRSVNAHIHNPQLNPTPLADHILALLDMPIGRPDLSGHADDRYDIQVVPSELVESVRLICCVS